MYECPNCGGNLKFDIEQQLLKCDYCLTTQDPYKITKDKDAEEDNQFDVTVFTCPQCGGEIFATDNSAAEFCSFCGASTILDSRISKERRPAWIIPFSQTKDACKKAYGARLKRALFAPDALKDEKAIESFRGIYMPYWSYSISQKGNIAMKGKKSYRRGDYVYTNHYDMGGFIDAYYHDLSYDASSSFSDNISECIAPFHVKGMRKFTPSFLSGFYADTADVDRTLYEKDALNFAMTNSRERINRVPEFSGIQFSLKDTDLHSKMERPERVMYPVWFMSYRKNDRVAYATVNGQTGKVAADIPIDIKKYIIGSLILAVPIFLLLNMNSVITATSVLNISILLEVVALITYLVEISRIHRRDSRKDDRGYLANQKNPSQPSLSFKTILHDMLGLLLAIMTSMCIFLFAPVEDAWYYGGTIAAYLGILPTIVAIIDKYNILATRRLPQFDRKGGDDDA